MNQNLILITLSLKSHESSLKTTSQEQFNLVHQNPKIKFDLVDDVKTTKEVIKALDFIAYHL